VLHAWRELLGQNVLELADLDAVCETIALTVGLGEEAIDLASGLGDLRDAGSTAGPTVERALAAIGAAPRALPAPRPAGGAGPGGGSRTRSDDTGLDFPNGSVLL
jgi:hypothetical protein